MGWPIQKPYNVLVIQPHMAIEVAEAMVGPI